MVKLLIDKGVNLKNYDASVTLWRAINHRNFEIAQLLIDNGVKAKFSFSSKLLHRACETNDIEVIDLLVKAKVNVNLKNEYGYTPIYKAVLANNTEAIKRLLNAKCDLNIKCGKEKNTVFDIAKGEVKDILEANRGLCEVNKTNKIFNYIRTII
jgi:ankyrin repeat protein